MPSVLHVSDVHFGPKHLPEIAAALLDLARRAPPDLVVVSGDLTQRAKPYQFREARAWVDAFGVPVAWVPGNHDVPMYRVWERLFAPFGAWRRHFDPDLVRDQRVDGVAAVGVNTAFSWTVKHGRLRPADLADLDRRLARLSPEITRIVVAHHPLALLPELGGEPAARGGAAALAACGRRRVDLVLSGHLHHGFSGPVAAGNPLVLHAGTATSSRGRGLERGRNSFNWIEIEENALAVEHRFWDPVRGAFATENRRRFPRPCRL